LFSLSRNSDELQAIGQISASDT